MAAGRDAFLFLSDDDILLPHFLRSPEGFETYPSAMFSAGSVISMTEGGEVIGSRLSSWPKEGIYLPPQGLLQMMGSNHPTWTGVLFRREVISNIGFLDEEVGVISDMDFELRIAALSPFGVPQTLCHLCSTLYRRAHHLA
jgi:hypothetical protein